MSPEKRPGPPPGTRRTIRIDVQYDGTGYVGWQRQAKGRSIQALLEKALGEIAGEKVTLHAAGRTDAGVHARAQVASFSLRRCAAPVGAFVKGTNARLPPDIRVIDAREAAPGFLARRDARAKTYRYFLRIGPEPDVFLRNYSWRLAAAPDLDAMQAAAAALLGTHDWSSFRAGRSQTRTSTRTVRRAQWIRGPLGTLCFEITADGFLRHMVRTIVGTLVEIGLGKRPARAMEEIIAARDRRRAGVTAPPQGLFLWSVAL